MKRQNNQKAKDEMTVANAYISVITLNLNKLNSPKKTKTEKQS